MLAKSIEIANPSTFEIAGRAQGNKGEFILTTDGCSAGTFEELAKAIESAISPLGWKVDIYERNHNWRFLAITKD